MLLAGFQKYKFITGLQHNILTFPSCPDLPESLRHLQLPYKDKNRKGPEQRAKTHVLTPDGPCHPETLKQQLLKPSHAEQVKSNHPPFPNSLFLCLQSTFCYCLRELARESRAGYYAGCHPLISVLCRASYINNRGQPAEHA